MHFKRFILYGLFIGLFCCTGISYTLNTTSIISTLAEKQITANNPYNTVNEIPLPSGFTRINRSHDSFGQWLTDLKLKRNKTVYLYDGTPKANQTAQFAVIDISVGDKNLQQCADAVMRLRAEYLFKSGKYSDIHFSDNNGKVYQFDRPYTIGHLHQYLEKVFGMCGSASLSKQLTPAYFNNIEPGNILIRGGFPGHVVIIIDVAANKEGKKIFMLAQSYMPAQNIHVLVNPMDKTLSPWYEANGENAIVTPEYIFTNKEMKSW